MSTTPDWRDVLRFQFSRPDQLHGDHRPPPASTMVEAVMAEQRAVAFCNALAAHADACDAKLSRFLDFVAGQGGVSDAHGFAIALDAFEQGATTPSTPRTLH